MRLARLIFSSSYVVDLDDKAMVEMAKVCIVEDVYGAARENEVESGIKIVKDAKLKKGDIPSFLLH
jgi:hypothetical protein